MTHPRSDTPAGPPTDDLEQDSRFPSGPWTGFFLQPGAPGRHMMQMVLTFRSGVVRGEGRDRVGPFLIVGRYDVADGRCRWTKRYLARHDISYGGYNEGRGIWGVWEDPQASYWRGGFHIWPEAMGNPYGLDAAEEVEEPEAVGVGLTEEFAVGAAVE